MTIEEAWNALELRQGDEGLAKAVRVAMLAVLEEAVESGNRILVEVAGEDPIFDGHTIRKRIEELGR